MISFQVQCLNILQRLRGSALTGYVSLFRKNNDILKNTSNTKNNPADNEFDEILDSIEDEVKKNRYQVKNPKYRKRTVNTV